MRLGQGISAVSYTHLDVYKRQLYSPQVYSTGDIIDTYVYRIGVIEARFDLATAVGLFKSAISFVLIMFGYKLADKLAGYKVF